MRKLVLSLLIAAALCGSQEARADHAYPIHLTTGADTFSVDTQRAVHVYAYGGADHVHVGDFNDTLEGMYGDDYLNGGGGNDILIGGIGRDYLVGGAGWDVCRGNSGANTYVGCEVIS